MSKRNKYDWPKLLKEYEDSGLTQVAFCQSKGINAKYFSLNRARILRETPDGFVKIAVSSPKKHSVMSFKFSNGEFFFDTSVDPDYIASLIRAL